jgi:GNAT superfamily N-acetyltransferase
MIRPCKQQEFDAIWNIITDASAAYKGIIPADCWGVPYMTREKLRHEIEDGVVFWGFEQDGALQGVMGVQDVLDVTLIRHAYVRTSKRRSGIGGRLLRHLEALTRRPVLVGTWADASWAIHFYEKHGFRLIPAMEKDQLLYRYWNVPARQVETSVVLLRGEIPNRGSTPVYASTPPRSHGEVSLVQCKKGRRFRNGARGS